jgi:hypothetical protein
VPLVPSESGGAKAPLTVQVTTKKGATLSWKTPLYRAFISPKF